jgi:hypothetical protein
MLIWVPSDHLDIAIYDAMRPARLETRPTKLTEADRRILAESITARFRLSGWRVVRREVPAPTTPGPTLEEQSARLDALRQAREPSLDR